MLSLPVRGAWIEIDVKCLKARKILSLPVRGAWIEMSKSAYLYVIPTVAPRAGSVD